MIGDVNKIMKQVETSNDSNWKISLLDTVVRLFPLMFILAVVPLIVRVYPYMANMSQFPWFTSDDFQIDFFLHGKSAALTAMGIYMVVILGIYALIGNIERKNCWILIPLGIYGAFTLFSSVFSQYSYYSFHGSFEGFETVWVILTYCVIVVYACFMVKSSKDVRILLYTFAIGVFILTIIGFFQAFGKNPLNMSWITNLTVPSKYKETLDGLVEYNIGNYLTLYNINYVGVYMSMTLPVLLFLMLDFSKNKSFSSIKATFLTILNVVIFAVLFVAAFFCLYKSDSEAGILAFCIGLIFVPIVLYRKIWKHKIATLVSVVVIAAIALLINDTYLKPAFVRLKNQLTSEPRSYDLSDIHVDSDGVTFTYKGEKLTLKMEEIDTDYFVVRAYDGDGNELTFNSGSWVLTFEDPRFADFSIAYYPIADELSMSITVGDTNWVFTNQTSPGTYQLLNYYGNWVNMEEPPRITALDGREDIFSGRGYIWSRSIPLLKQYIVMGAGADAFTFAFPQMDYIGRLHSGYAENQLFTKPHNMYLQTAVQSGIIALLGFLVFYFMYFVQSFKIYSKKVLDTFVSHAGLGILIGTIVYMIAGLTNDSMVVVAPVFWTLLGIGISINFMIAKEENVKDVIE